MVRPDGLPTGGITDAAVQIGIRLSKDEMVYRLPFDKHYLGTVYPVATLSFTAGIPGLLRHSPEYYDYLQQLNDAASGSNPIFATPAGPVKDNISGGAYGAFGVYTVSRQKQAVPYYPGTWTDEQMTKRFGHDWKTLFDEQTE